jgi:hypothetical protein
MKFRTTLLITAILAGSAFATHAQDDDQLVVDDHNLVGQTNNWTIAKVDKDNKCIISALATNGTDRLTIMVVSEELRKVYTLPLSIDAIGLFAVHATDKPPQSTVMISGKDSTDKQISLTKDLKIKDNTAGFALTNGDISGLLPSSVMGGHYVYHVNAGSLASFDVDIGDVSFAYRQARNACEIDTRP